MQTSHKIIAFLIYSILIFGAGWSMRPVEKQEQKTEISENLDQKKATDVAVDSENKNELKSKKTNYRADGSVESVEESLEISFAKYSMKMREIEELKKQLLLRQEIVIQRSQPKVIISLVQSYNIRTSEFGYKDVLIQGNVFGNAYLGAGYEQRTLANDKKEDIAKTVFSMAF